VREKRNEKITRKKTGKKKIGGRKKGKKRTHDFDDDIETT
jgi:hypothetical protein